MSHLAQFIYLQLLDILTTLAFLINGAKEANPVVRLAIGLAPSPLVGLLAVKLFALVLALYCVRRARLRLLGRVNILFAVLVTWNLLVIILSAPALRS